MKKIDLKFAISLTLLINAVIFVIFFKELVYVIENYLFPLFFIYFLVDSVIILLPKFNNMIYSSKMDKKKYIEVPNYNQDKLENQVKSNNKTAFMIFIIYFGIIVIFGLSYLSYDWFDRKFIYLIFFALNFSDYFCIVLWCPFQNLFLKNSCCNTCRISNWDRLMKFAILIFIPNFYTISIFVLAVIIFLYWEFQHFKNPQMFYQISNKNLWCINCDVKKCQKNQEYINKKE
jgi:hypothetical protein